MNKLLSRLKHASFLKFERFELESDDLKPYATAQSVCDYNPLFGIVRVEPLKVAARVALVLDGFNFAVGVSH